MMNCQKICYHVKLISYSIITVILFITFISLKNAHANFLFSARIDYNSDNISYSVAIGDLDGDSDLDVAVGSRSNYNASVLLGNGDGSLQGEDSYGAGLGPKAIAIGDLNGDGYLDMAVTNELSNNVSVFINEGPDTDGDGIPDDEDACPNSDLSERVIIDSCDSGVDNMLFDDGCTISDLIYQCAESASNHGQFTSGVSHMTNYLKKDGTISAGEKGAIQGCAASAGIP